MTACPDATLTRRTAGRARREAGFTYLMVLASVVVIGILAEVTHLTTWRILKADKEAELLFRGQAYLRAIQSYYESAHAAAGAIKSYPRSLDDLLEDPRFPGRRHIRALYPDPMGEGGKGEWLLIRAPDGGISGVASRGKEVPLKQANFPKGLEHFAGAQAYSDWIFEYRPASPTRAPVPRPAPSSAAVTPGQPSKP